jgi:hypothetical protein
VRQMHDGRGNNHQAYLWQYSQPGGAVIFDFQLSRAREGRKQFLGNFKRRAGFELELFFRINHRIQNCL